MNRMMAIVEREMRKFFRSPALMLVAMVFPLVQLMVLGNAFGGKIRDAKLGLVDEDGGTQALEDPRGFRFGPRQYAHFRTHLLLGRKASGAGHSQRQNPGRGNHSPAVFPPGLRTKTSRASRWWLITATTS